MKFMFMQLFFLKFTQSVTILQTVSNQEVGLKSLLRQRHSEPEFYGDLVHK